MANSADKPLPRTRRRASARSAVVALGVSALIHIPLMLLLPALFDGDQSDESADLRSERSFSVEVVDQATSDNDPKQEDDEEELTGEFIRGPVPEKEETPDEARFRDQFESKVDEQMAVKKPGASQGPSANSSATDQGGVALAPSPEGYRRSPSNTDRTPDVDEVRPGSRSDASSESKSESDSTEPSSAERRDEGREAPDLEAESAEEGLVEESTGGAPDVDGEELFPTYADAAGLAGGGGQSYLRDVPEGHKTLLNRKRSRYWSFMDRVRRQVSQQWSPVEEYRRRDPHGEVYGVKDKVTIVRVTLEGDGSVRKLRVAHPSGIGFYDDEAIRALNTASPFENPPEGLKDQDGLIHFNFMFVLSVHSESPLIRVRRR